MLLGALGALVGLVLGGRRFARRAYAGGPPRWRLAAGADLRQRRQAALALDKEVPEPVAHDLQVLGAPERRARSG